MLDSPPRCCRACVRAGRDDYQAVDYHERKLARRRRRQARWQALWVYYALGFGVWVALLFLAMYALMLPAYRHDP